MFAINTQFEDNHTPDHPQAENVVAMVRAPSGAVLNKLIKPGVWYKAHQTHSPMPNLLCVILEDGKGIVIHKTRCHFIGKAAWEIKEG